MFIWDKNKSTEENLNTQAMIEALERNDSQGVSHSDQELANGMSAVIVVVCIIIVIGMLLWALTW